MHTRARERAHTHTHARALKYTYIICSTGYSSEDANTLGLHSRALADANGHKEVLDFFDTPPETQEEK